MLHGNQVIALHGRSRSFGMLLLCAGVMLVLSGAANVPAETGTTVKPAPRDKCPVCGMFVAKYPDWASAVVYTDGARAYFDGPKDLFTYYFGLSRYAPGRNRTEISEILVTDYYGLTAVNGRDAWYVLGSDVYGPMGKELVPFARKQDAHEFSRDHGGKRVLQFRDITPDTLRQLE